MSFYQECLRIVKDNKNNPHPELFYMTMCLKHWHTRKQIYSTMKSITYTDSERRLISHNCFGEDTLMERLIEKNYIVEHMLKLILDSAAIERNMFNNEIFDRNHIVIPMLEQLTELLLPIWKEEVKKHKLECQKNHPEIKQIIYFTLNLRDYFEKKDNDVYVEFFLKLLNENF